MSDRNIDQAGAAAAHVGPPALLERMIFFSDAVFAIAITLLIIEIHVPHLPHDAGVTAHLQALADLMPSFTGFFVSFAVIGAFWAGHHRAFGLATHYAPGLVLPNLMMLCAIALMPFATAYLSENYGAVVPTALYNILLLITGLLNLRLIRRVTGAPYTDEGGDALQLAAIRARGWGVTIGAALALATSFVAPWWAQPMLLTVPVWMRLAVYRATRSATGTSTETE